jgi:hypothetical protein
LPAPKWLAVMVARLRTRGGRVGALAHWREWLGPPQTSGRRSGRGRLFALSLLVPWLILVLVAEPGRSERFLWLWPLQVIGVAAFATHVLGRARRQVAWLVQLGLVFVLVADPVLSRVDAWQHTGWAGPDAEEVQVVDYAATYLRAEGKDRVAIGYQTFVYPFMARYHAIDPQYKVGAEFDLLFKYRYGIVNLDQCGEGLSPADDYRIIQNWPQSTPGAPVSYFEVSSPDNFRTLGRVASYDVVRHV